MSEVGTRESAVSGLDLPSVFVWGSWAALTLGLLGFALWGGAGAFPIVDDWSFLVPRLSLDSSFAY